MKSFGLLHLSFILVEIMLQWVITKQLVPPPIYNINRGALRMSSYGRDNYRSSNSRSRDGGRNRYGGNRDGRSKWGSGGGGRYGRPQMDPTAQLRFKKTVKIDPDFQTAIDELGVSDKTLEVLRKKNFEVMTPVQSQSYSHVYDGEDVVARSRTGTGKTIAFGLPIIEKLVQRGLNEMRSGRDLPLVLVLEPTRELAMQVSQELSKLCSVHRMRVHSIYGGSSYSVQERAIRDGVHILVATPGRMLDHIRRGTVDLGNVRHVVLDEGDTMLEMGFQKDVETIIMNVKSPGAAARRAAADALMDYGAEEDEGEDDDEDWEDEGNSLYDPLDDETDARKEADAKKAAKHVQMLLFSATMPGWICSLTDKHMEDPIFLDAVQEGETRLAATIKHLAVRLPNVRMRMDGVRTYVEDLILTEGKGGQTIVFTNTKEEADTLVASDSFGQLKSMALHGDIGQNSRQATIRQFKEGKIDVLVATDVAARGLDIAGVDLVVHTGPPNDPDTYVHRSGRTGRAGRNGTAILLYSAPEERKLSMFEKVLKFRFQRAGPPSPDQITEASAAFASKKLQQVNPEVVQYFLPYARDMLESLKSGKMVFDQKEVDDAEEEEDEGASLDEAEGPESTEVLFARCMAAISNRHTIASRSLLTGQEEFMTLQVGATFRNGTSPDNIRDWLRLVTGVFRRHLELDEFRFGKMSLARSAAHLGSEERRDYYKGKGNLDVLVDLDYDTAQQVMRVVKERGLPQGVRIDVCKVLPELVQDPTVSFGGGGRGRGGGGSFRRGGDRGGRYGGDRRSRADRPAWEKRGSGYSGSRHH